VAVVTLVVGVPEEDVVGKQDGAGCNRDVALGEKEVVGKQDGAGFNRDVRLPEEVVGKKWRGF